MFFLIGGIFFKLGAKNYFGIEKINFLGIIWTPACNMLILREKRKKILTLVSFLHTFSIGVNLSCKSESKYPIVGYCTSSAVRGSALRLGE